MRAMSCSETFLHRDKEPGAGINFYDLSLTKLSFFEWCPEQPCLCRGMEFCLLTHVDDIMYAGSRKFWHEVFLLAFQKAFTVSYSELGDVGSEISFLKRRIRRLPGGLALVPGTSIDALVQKVEAKLGNVRLQSMPGDASLQREDTTKELSSGDASFYRMAVGVCLYLISLEIDLTLSFLLRNWHRE